MRLFLFALLLLLSKTSFSQPLPLHLLKLPPHYQIQIFAYPIENARQMALGKAGTVFVGSRGTGKVYAIIPDPTKPDKTKVMTIASGLNMPNGVAFYQNSLYVAEVNRILRFDDIEKNLNHPPKPIVVRADLPQEMHHGWRYIAFGPDQKLYIGIGAPCNSCESKDPRFATLMRMNADGSDMAIYARGIRNTVGFDWHPKTKQLWFTDNGQDGMGDTIPPDELNVAPKPGLHFGFPYFHGNQLPDPKYATGHEAKQFTPATYALPAHVAALGMKFYRGSSILIAEHGSWDSSKKVGYQVIKVNLDKNNHVLSTEPFVMGWLQEQTAWGRPVDILELKDGSILISDDKAGAIYRISYQQEMSN